MTLTYAEFCAGYGGLGLAVEAVFDAELSWYSEFEAAPSTIMAHHWPDAPNHGDMTRIDFNRVEPVNILSGGTPCPDLSTAGRRAGMRKGTRSGLWESMREAIAIIQPRYVVWENVRGAYSAGADSEVEQCPGCMGEARDGEHFLRALGRVLGDLSDLGYDTQWCGLRAADVGAPHGRFRVFILAERRDAEPASANHAGLERQRDPHGAASTERHGHAGQGVDRSAAHADDQRGDRRGEWSIQDGRGQPADRSDLVADARSNGRHGWPDLEGAGRDQAVRGEEVNHPIHSGVSRPDTDWGPYAPAIHRWEQLRGPAPTPTELTAKGKHRLSATFVEWMMGLPAGWVTDIDISRNEQLKALGNGVVPAQAAAALDHMLSTQEMENAA